jgi:hypothetical protein
MTVTDAGVMYFSFNKVQVMYYLHTGRFTRITNITMIFWNDIDCMGLPNLHGKAFIN